MVLAIGISPAGARSTTHSEPLFELGVIGIGGYFPDYPAANQYHLHAIPLPYVVYRGSFLQVEGTSARGVLVDKPRFGFDISANGSFGTSGNNTARRGMPKLDKLGEIGPRLRLTLARDATNDAEIEIEVPARAVFSTNLTSSFNYRGLRLVPEIAYIHHNFLNTGGRFKLGFAADFSTQELTNYFYGVAPQFVTAQRPQYTAQAGYLGSHLDASYRIPLNGRMTLYTSASAAYYGGAANAASPLFKSNHNFTVAAAISFSFYRSDTLVEGRE